MPRLGKDGIDAGGAPQAAEEGDFGGQRTSGLGGGQSGGGAVFRSQGDQQVPLGGRHGWQAIGELDDLADRGSAVCRGSGPTVIGEADDRCGHAEVSRKGLRPFQNYLPEIGSQPTSETFSVSGVGIPFWTGSLPCQSGSDPAK